MKTRITILAENNKPLSVLGDNPETKVKRAWEFVLSLIHPLSEDDETCIIENVEVEE